LFAKGGGDAYLFDMQFPNVPESVTRTHISVSYLLAIIVFCKLSVLHHLLVQYVCE